MVANNLACREWSDNQLHKQAQQYPQQYPKTQEDLEGIAAMNRARENLEEIEHRIEARFTPEVRTIDELIRRQLSDQQLGAINLLVQGISDADVARAVNVHRATVARWRLFHPAFVAELNRRRQEEIAQAGDKLRKLSMIAIDALTNQLQDDTNPALRVKAALAIVKMAGVENFCKQRKPLSAEEMIDDIALANRKRKHGTIDNGEREDVLGGLAIQCDTCFGGQEPVCKTSTASDASITIDASKTPDEHSGVLENVGMSGEENTRLIESSDEVTSTSEIAHGHSDILENARMSDDQDDPLAASQVCSSNDPPASRSTDAKPQAADEDPKTNRPAAQQTDQPERDCCALKSSVDNGLSARRATGATMNNSPVDGLPEPGEVAQCAG